ncbi:MAG: hypothetical protein MSIBF_03070 [Candidatus Altiarchaeales archaeon IMC4]|nr:MAG: hypothetical protein MSIBF_03070 [Candidatus Altiarchaeales archaeon IMC4]
MAERFSEPVSQKGLNRFLTEYVWSPDELNDRRIEAHQEDPKMRWHAGGVVSLDDTLIEKSGKKIPGAGKFYDHSTGSFVHAQNIVTSHYADWQKHYPVAFRQYYKEGSKEAAEHGFRTKIQLAMELVDDAEGREFPGVYVADTWFFCKELVDHIEGCSKSGVMGAKSDPRELEIHGTPFIF